MADEARFYSKNFVTKNNVNTVLTGAATIPRFFDRDTELKYSSAGSNDSIQEFFRSDFQSGGQEIERTIDTIIILGHNLVNFTVQSFDGTTHTTVAGGAIVGESNTFTVVTFSALLSKGIQILMDTAVSAGEKRVGEVLALSTLFAWPTDDNFSAIAFNPLPSAVVGAKFDGGIQVNQLRFAGNRTERFRSRIDAVLQSKANYDSLRSVFREANFNVYAEPVQRPEEIFLVTAIPTPPSAAYASTFKGSGFNISAELREV